MVPYAAGGSVDVTTRIVAKTVGQELRRAIVVANVPGASGLLAVRKVLQAPHDGCTLLAATPNTVALLPMLNPHAGFTSADLRPLARIGGTDMVVVASLASGLNDLDDVRRASVEHSTPLRAGHPGHESLQAVSLRILQRKLHVEFIEVPYSGAGQLVTELLGGHLDLAVLAKPVALPLIRRGALRQLVVLTADQGYPAGSWSGWFSATDVPGSSLASTIAAVNAATRDPGTRQLLAEIGVDVNGADGAAFAREITTTIEHLREELAATVEAAGDGAHTPSKRR